MAVSPRIIQHAQLIDALQSAANMAAAYGVPVWVIRDSYYDGMVNRIGYSATPDRPDSPGQIVALYLPKGAVE